jgi:hypothetical protein
MEPEGSLTCSHDPGTGPCPEPDESNQNTHMDMCVCVYIYILIYIHFNIMFSPSYRYTSQVISSLQIF